MTFLYAFFRAILLPFKTLRGWFSAPVRQEAMSRPLVQGDSDATDGNGVINGADTVTVEPMTAIKAVGSSSDAKQQVLPQSNSSFVITQANRGFGLSFFQKKLSQFAADGQFEHLFKLYSSNPELRLRQQILFALAGSAEQDKMEVILKEHPELLTVSAPLTDISGVYFESITVFQHAVWAGDVRYMANMMLDCIPNTEAGEQTRLKLVEQYNDLMANGVCCQFNGQTYREKQFSLTPLIKALTTYVNEFDNWDWLALENHWCKVVGGAQTRLPAHVRHHYCDASVSFYQSPDFRSAQLFRSLSFYNYASKVRQLWCSSVSGLGSVFGIFAGRGGAEAGGARAWPNVGDASIQGAGRVCDLWAMKELYKIRTEIDGPALKERLEHLSQKTEENSESRPGPI